MTDKQIPAKLLEARTLHKSYHDGQRELQVLRGASLTVHAGEAVAVIGMSGAGKSTMLHLLGGLDRPDKGEVHVEGQSLDGAGAARLDRVRQQKVGYVFQFHHLLPEFSALENVAIAARIAGCSPSEAGDRAAALLDRLGLSDRLTHRPSKLSGGEQQRVALARALINEPSVLLADEPTGNLDRTTGDAVIDVMWELTVGAGRGLLVVTHEPLIAARADRALRLSEGRLHKVTDEELAAATQA